MPKPPKLSKEELAKLQEELGGLPENPNDYGFEESNYCDNLEGGHFKRSLENHPEYKGKYVKKVEKARREEEEKNKGDKSI